MGYLIAVKFAGGILGIVLVTWFILATTYIMGSFSSIRQRLLELRDEEEKLKAAKQEDAFIFKFRIKNKKRDIKEECKYILSIYFEPIVIPYNAAKNKIKMFWTLIKVLMEKE